MEAVQSRMLDAVGPLSAIHAAAVMAQEKRELMHPDSVLEAINYALVHLGNANSQATYQRQRSIMGKINPSAVSLLAKEKLEASETDLFGNALRKSIKEAGEARKDFGMGFSNQPYSGQRPTSFRPKFGRSPFREQRHFRGRPYDFKGRSSFRGSGTNSFRSSPKGESIEKDFKPLVGGRLKYYLHFWESITSDPWILNSVSGYSLPFKEIPNPYLNPPPHILGEDKSIIENEILSLLDKNAIEEASTQYFLNQIFLVPKKDGVSWRPILNLKPLNKYLRTEHFKMESVSLLRDILKPGMWLTKLDLKDAYFTVPISKPDRKYLQFSWGSKIYEYKCMPFGLATAPFTFTKITKPLVSLLRQEGILLLIYLDDLLILSESFDQGKIECSRVKSVFESAGFILNTERSVLNPSQQMEYLGIIVDTCSYTFQLPLSKRDKIVSHALCLLQHSHTTPRNLAKFIGQITATKLALRTSTLKVRQCQLALINALRQNENWDHRMDLPTEARQEINWWSEAKNLSLSSPILDEEPSLEIESDSSLQAWGAVCNGIRTGGKWTVNDLNTYTHINQLELYASFLALQCFWEPGIVSVKLKLDNQTAVSYLNKLGGTHSPSLNRLALEVWSWALQRKIWIIAEYLPGIKNTIADWESRNQTDRSSWKLHQKVFQQLMLHCPCKVDLFADRTNHQLQTYYSWKPDPNASGINAFLVNWAEMEAYAFPPFCLVGKCLQKLTQEMATVVLVAPVWTNQFWYPLLLMSSVAVPILLPLMNNLLRDPLGNIHPLVSQGRLHLAAWTVSGCQQRVARFRQKLRSSCPTPSGISQNAATMQHGRPTVAGVVGKTLIPFKLL